MELALHLNAYSKQAPLLRFLLRCSLVVFFHFRLFTDFAVFLGHLYFGELGERSLTVWKWAKTSGGIAERAKRATYLLNYLGKTLNIFSFFFVYN